MTSISLKMVIILIPSRWVHLAVTIDSFAFCDQTQLEVQPSCWALRPESRLGRQSPQHASCTLVHHRRDTNERGT